MKISSLNLVFNSCKAFNSRQYCVRQNMAQPLNADTVQFTGKSRQRAIYSDDNILGHNEPFYFVDIDGNLSDLYLTLEEASYDMGFTPNRIQDSYRTKKPIRDLMPVKTDDIEDEYGDIKLDALEEARSKIKDKSFYVLSKGCNPIRFNAPAEAAKLIGIPALKIYRFQNYNKNIQRIETPENTYALCKTAYIEHLNKNGKVQLNKNVINEALEKLQEPS